MPLIEGTEIHIVPSSGGRVAVEYIGTFDLMMSRGSDPDEVKLLTSRPQEFEALTEKPCAFEFSHNKGDLGAGKETFQWKGWYMQSLQPNPSRPGLYTATFRDYRAIAERQRLDLAYNVEWADTYFRSDTMTAAQKKWTCLEAAWDALEKFGFVVDKTATTLEAWQKKEILPSNLGNSKGGGFAGASPSEVVPILLEQIRCDYMMTPEGKVRVVGRSSAFDESPKLKLHRLIGGTVAKRNIKWQRPKTIKVLFERIMEGGWDYQTTSSSATASNPNPAFNTILENVMPVFDATSIGQTDRWKNISTQVIAQLGTDADDKIRKRWFKPNLFPYKRDANRLVLDDAPTIAKKQWFDDAVRRCWRRVFKVNPKVFTGFSYSRYFVGIRLGRLDEHGGVKSGGNVWMDYSRHTRWGRPRVIGVNGSADPIGLVFSENRYYALLGDTSDPGNIRSFLPAPFTTRWLSPENLVFEVQPQRPSVLNSVANYPGIMEEPLNYGQLVELASGSALRRTELKGSFKEAWNLRILWNGRLTAAIPPAAAIIAGPFSPSIVQRGRLWVEERPGFQDGLGATVHVKVDEVTANHVFSDYALERLPIGSIQGYMPDQLLNKAEIEDVADHVAEQIKQTYNQDRAGVAVVAGVSSLGGKVWTGGAIWATRLVVGGDGQDPSSLSVEYVVQPEVRPFRAKRKMQAGKPPAIAQDE